jgi:hypothetical protein
VTVEQDSVSCSGTVVMLQELLAEFMAVLPFVSTTWAVKLEVPAAVGVPVIAPVMALRYSPAGRPLTGVIENMLYGGSPPMATNEELYGTPTCPVLAEQLKLRGVCSVTVMVQPPVEAVEAVLPMESITWDMKLKLPVAVGVPLIKPVPEFKLIPGGSEPLRIENV